MGLEGAGGGRAGGRGGENPRWVRGGSPGFKIERSWELGKTVRTPSVQALFGENNTRGLKFPPQCHQEAGLDVM